MVYGGAYDIDKAQIVVSDESLKSWLREGACMKEVDYIAMKKAEAEEAKKLAKETEQAEEVKDDSVLQDDELSKIKKLESDPKDKTEDIKPPKEVVNVISITDDSDYPCTKDECYKQDDPYTQYWNFQKHMQKQHGETWEKEGDKLILKD